MKIKTYDFSYLISEDSRLNWLHSYLNKKEVWIKIKDELCPVNPKNLFFEVKKAPLANYLVYVQISMTNGDVTKLLIKDVYLSYRGKPVQLNKTIKFKNMVESLCNRPITVNFKGVRTLNVIYED